MMKLADGLPVTTSQLNWLHQVEARVSLGWLSHSSVRRGVHSASSGAPSVEFDVCDKWEGGEEIMRER